MVCRAQASAGSFATHDLSPCGVNPGDPREMGTGFVDLARSPATREKDMLTTHPWTETEIFQGWRFSAKLYCRKRHLARNTPESV